MAEKLGMSVRRCQAEIDSSEFAEWVAVDKINSNPIMNDSKIVNPKAIENTLGALYGSNK